MSDKKPTISFKKDGPIKVAGLDDFRNSRGEAIKARENMSLCRCGYSKNKPFCDGQHNSIGFSDEKQSDAVADSLDEHKGKNITILDNRGLCAHAGFCTSELPQVWNEKTWSDADAATKEEIIATIEKCPSGALSYAIDGKVHSNYHGDETQIQVSRNGPFLVRGDFALDAETLDGNSDDHYALCRCGQSKNKPFCDGSHWYAGFKDNEDITIANANRDAGDGEEEWAEIAKTGDFKIDEVKVIQLSHKRIAVTKTDKGFFAVDARCPHQGGPLGDGEVCEGKIRCPWHGFKFDLASGKGVGNDHSVDTITLKEEDGTLLALMPKPKRSDWTVSHLMMETLAEFGVDTVFGMVGHSNLGVAEAVRVQEQKGAMKFFGIRHEAAAAFACSGYAKVKNMPAACLAIAGPGATNLLTGLWDAKMDRAPVIALAGQVDSQVVGPGTFQEIDTPSAFQPVSNFCHTVLSDSNHSELAALACKSAIINRDVSTLIFPDEIQVQDIANVGPARPEGRISSTNISPPQEDISLASARIARSKKPLIIVGYGAKQGMENVLALAEKLNSPIITTFKGKGLIADNHPLGGGVLGASGTPVASELMSESDLLIVFGASFSKHTGIDQHRAIIQVDFDRMALGKFHAVDTAVWGDIGISADMMAEKITDTQCENQRATLQKLWKNWRTEKSQRAQENNQKGINSAVLFDKLSPHVPEDAILSVDVGNNTYSFGRYFECKGTQSVIMSGYLGSIGFGFPASMGAWAAVRGKQKVVAVAGDGGFGQYLAEFTTAVKYGMNITLILLHNGELGKISKEQRDGEWQVWQTSLQNPNFSEYAKLCGGDGVRVEKQEDLDKAFAKGLASPKPFIVEIMTDALLT